MVSFGGVALHLIFRINFCYATDLMIRMLFLLPVLKGDNGS